MRLAIIEQHPRFGGGSERMALALGQHALSRGHEVSLVHVEGGDMVSAYARAGANCHRLPILPLGVRRPITAWRSFAGLKAFVRQQQIDVLFTSQMAYVPLVAAVGVWTGTRTAAHLGLPLRDSHPVTRAGRYALDLGITPSVHTAAQLRDAGWRIEALQVIPNGVDTTTFSPGDRAADLGACQRPVVAYVGRLVVEKGIFTLLRAFARYTREGGRGSLLFVGAAPNGEVDELRSVAREEGLDENAWSIRPPTAAPEEVYRAVDLVVMPSEWDEPFGLVALEAAACGTVAIVSDRGVLPDFVTPLGVHGSFPSGDVAVLHRRIRYWLENDHRRSAAAAELSAYVRTHYAFERCGDAYLEAFQALLARQHDRPAETGHRAPLTGTLPRR
jgi:glycosyltransferase involved in cell wall biosynthesis